MRQYAASATEKGICRLTVVVMGRRIFPVLAEVGCFVPQGKLVQLLRNIQTEQFTKLQQRYQLQVDLLEDVR